MRALIAAVAALGLSVSGCGAAASADDVEQRAQDLVGQAFDQTHMKHPGCQPGSGAPRPSHGRADGAPSRWLVEHVGVLRRPQRGEEARFSAKVTGRSPFFPLVGDRLYAAATRLIDIDGGRRFALTVARSTPNSLSTAADHDTCLALRQRELRRLLAGSPARVRQRALTINASFELTARPLPTPPDAIGLAAVDQSGLRAGGPIAASWFFEDGLWGLGPSSDGSAVFGLVPDNVATVRAEFGQRRAQARVRENVFFMATSLPMDRAVPERLVWLDGDGAAIKIVATHVVSSDFARG